MILSNLSCSSLNQASEINTNLGQCHGNKYQCKSVQQ